MSRPSWDEHFMGIAQAWARMGTCARRQVGCVLVDDCMDQLSTGFNGVPHKWEHCRDNPSHECPGANAKSGTNLDQCYALHAEQNAILRCADKLRIHTCYTTVSPCATVCIKELLQTACQRIVFLVEYPQPEAKELWTRSSVLIMTRAGVISGHRTWEQYCVPAGYSDEYKSSTKILGSSGLR